MDTTTSALLRQIADSLQTLSTPTTLLQKPEFWGLGASLLASFIALLVAGGVGKYIRPLLGIKSELMLIRFERFRQSHHVWRLAIINNGKDIARNVQVNVIKIYDEKAIRENFIPMPLRWTYIDTESRNILPKQTAYLDIIEHHTNAHLVNLATRFGGGIDDFRNLNKGRSKLLLVFNQEDGRYFTKSIEISWDGTIFLDGKLEGKKWRFTKNGNFIN